jgi:iron(III) transport system substrate-binding protein
MKRFMQMAGMALCLTPALLLGAKSAAAQAEFGSPELIAAAKKEGRLVFYTANFAEPEQEVIKGFNKRFPEIKVEMVRAPGGQLITRIQTEAAAGKLLADVVDHSDRGLMSGIADLFADYTPPNANDYREDSRAHPKFWPAVTLGWAIAYNSALIKTPPATWMDLLKPEYGNKTMGQVVGPSGGTTWTRSMFERQVLGEDYWAKQAAVGVVFFPSGAPMADAMVRGEITVGPLLYNIAFLKTRDGAPIESVFAPEGVPIIPYADGVTKASANPNAARLFLNWRLSVEGQKFMIENVGNITSLKTPPVYPKGWDPAKVKVWLPDPKQFETLRAGWLDEWNKIYNYRQ